MCAIPEGRGIFPNLTVRENLRIWTYRGGITIKDVEEKTFATFPRLKDRRRQMAGTLSGGEQQMLAISRALVTGPKVLLLDELSMGLAPLIVNELYELVGSLARQGMTILMVEQFVTTALSVATRAAIMVHGRIEQEGTPREMADAALERLPGLRPAGPGPARRSLLVGQLHLERRTWSDSVVTRSTTPPASRRSSSAERRAAMRSEVSATVSVATGHRIERLAVVLARRTCPRTSATTSSTGPGSSGSDGPNSDRSGHGDVWIDPACHHDHTSSVTKGRIGASSRSRAERARARAAWAEAGPGRAASP